MESIIEGLGFGLARVVDLGFQGLLVQLFFVGVCFRARALRFRVYLHFKGLGVSKNMGSILGSRYKYDDIGISG